MGDNESVARTRAALIKRGIDVALAELDARRRIAKLARREAQDDPGSAYEAWTYREETLKSAIKAIRKQRARAATIANGGV